MRQRGFSLIELMIGVAVGAIVMTGLAAGGLAMQRRSLLEEQTLVAQTANRAATDVLVAELQRAGAGLGNARLNTDGATYEGALKVITNDAFAADATFSPPTGPYAGRISDSITVVYGVASAMVPLTCCGGGACLPGDRMRAGVNACVARDPSTVMAVGQRVLFVNPGLGVACLHQITGFPSSDKIQTNPGRAGNPPPSSEPCDEASGNFWGTPGGYAMVAGGSRMRVNWPPVPAGIPPQPVLELDPDGEDGPLPFTEVSRSVERIKVRLGIASPSAPIAAPADIVWFPDGGPRPGADQCTSAAVCPDALIPGLDPLDAPLSQLEKIMRRLHYVELELTGRATRRDLNDIRMAGAVFALDADGNPRDGFKRRTWTVRVGTRNFTMAGITP